MSSSTPNIEAIQAALRQQKIDGWLFYDILHRDPIAYRVLGLGHVLAKRRWFYGRKGSPRKLVHRIEAATLDTLPGDKMLYAAAEEPEMNLKKLVGHSAKKVAMQFPKIHPIHFTGGRRHRRADSRAGMQGGQFSRPRSGVRGRLDP